MMKRRSHHNRNRTLKSRRFHPQLGEALEARVMLAVDGLSPTVRSAFEQAADINRMYTRGQLRDTQQWVVLMSDGNTGATLANALGTTTSQLTSTDLLANTYLVDTLTIVPPDTSSVGTGGLPIPPTPENVVAKLKSVPGIEYFYPLVPFSLEKYFIPSDDLFQDQWHLLNTGQSGGSPGADANIVDVWDTYNGAGVVIAIVDDGLQTAHPDLTDRMVDGLSFDFVGNDDDPNPETDFDGHGTSVAGVAAATQGNLIGGVGAAFGAGLAGFRLLGGPTTDLTISNAMSLYGNQIDIYNNSWGKVGGTTLVGGNPLTLAAIERQIAQPRQDGGIGNIYVFAAGNSQAIGDNVNYSTLTNSRYTIAVGAIGDDGVQSSYSNPGASLVVSAHSSNNLTGITTTDLQGEAGYNIDADTGDYTDTFGGTSSAAPLVSGGIALMLQANPLLSWRDVQHVLVRSAALTDRFDDDWVTNGAGLHVNHKYGFGAFDAEAAVALAETWVNVDDEVSIESTSVTPVITIPDNDARGVSSSILVTQDISVEWVEIKPVIEHTVRGDLEIVLTSPSGTESVLAEQRGKRDAGEYSDWIFTTNRNWGETSLGTWTLTVRDKATGATGRLESWEMTIYGTEVDPNPVTTGSISGFKWNDANANGVRDPLENGLANWVIYVDRNSDGNMNPGEPAALTDASGNYTIVNVPAGIHAVREQQKLGWQQTFPLNNRPQTVVVSGGSVANINFGNRVQPGQISGTKWNDLDADGVQDKKELGVAGVRIFIDSNRNGRFEETEPYRITDSSGNYSFNNLAAGIYQVREEAIAGIPQTYPRLGFHTVDVGLGETFDLDFGNVFDSSSAYGTAWLDADGDGLIDSTESRLPQLIVYADQNNDGRIGYGEPAAVTDASGNYHFVNLPAGNPSIRAVVPPGYYQISPTAGGYLLAVNVGTAAANLNFGMGVQKDFGDAPAPYPTLLADNGPMHPIETGFFLGANVDSELNGIPSATAAGDDGSVTDDENGVVFATPLIAGSTARLEVTASKQGYLQGWIDFNADGDWLDAGEQILKDTLVSAGLSRLVIQVPSYAVDEKSFARFRFAHESGLSFVGAASSGEVEDYQVTLVNDSIPVTPAQANDDLLTVDKNSANNFLIVLANDASGGVGLTIDGIGTPNRGGSVSLAPDGRRLVYSPAVGFIGVETFNYVVRNGNGETDSALVTVNVREVALAVDAINDSYTINQNTTNNALAVLANDTLGSGGRTITAVGATNRGGVVTIAAGAQSLLYTPAAGFVGIETFTYTLRDSAGSTDTATVTVTVQQVILANAGDDAATVEQNSSNNPLNVLANDVSNSAIVISAVGTPSQGGTVTISGDAKTLLYSPAPSFLGTETFTYTIRDAEGDTDTATVTITVQEAVSVTAVDDGFSITGNTADHILNVLANDSFTGPGSLTISSVTNPSNGGTVSIVSNGTRIRYSPANNFVGTETFTYTITTGNGITDTAVVTMTVSAVETKNIRFRLETTTAAGVPITQINVGGTFQLRGYVKDLRTNPEGVFAGFLDVTYNGQLANATGTINHGTQFTNGVGGTIATDGIIDEVGGINKESTGNGDELLLFSVNFTADAAGTLNFVPDPADVKPLHDVLLLGIGTAIPTAEIDFRGTSITVTSLTNLANSLDVNADNFVSAIDALLVINELNRGGARSITTLMAADARPTGFVDTNGDGFVSAIDALLIINHLNKAASQTAVAPPPAQAAIPASSADAALADEWSFRNSTNSKTSKKVSDTSIDLFADEIAGQG